MLFCVFLLVCWSIFNFSARSVDDGEFQSFIREVVQRRDESCKCSDTVSLLNKLIDDFENMAGTVREIEGHTALLTTALQSHDDRLRLHDQSLKKFTDKVCPPGFEFLPEVNGCFRVIFQGLSWARAGEVCRNVMPGVHLAAVTSAVKQEAIAKYLQRQFTKKESAYCVLPGYSGDLRTAWTSGQTPDPARCDGNFVWKTLGARDMPFTYTNWANAQPDCATQGNRKETCMHMIANWDYKWNDMFCDLVACPLCEF